MVTSIFGTVQCSWRNSTRVALYYMKCITFHAYRFPRERLRILKKAGGLFSPQMSRFFRCSLSPLCSGTDINLSIINLEYSTAAYYSSTRASAAESHKQILVCDNISLAAAPPSSHL